MTSMRRIEANRRNAQLSTGPKTAAGKAKVAQNAVTTGLLARETLLPDEDPQALERLAEALHAEWKPQRLREEDLVDLMVRARWRLCRLGRVEAGIFTWNHCGILLERANYEATGHEHRAVTTADPQKHQQALAAVAQLRELRKGPTATMGFTFIRGSSGGDVFSKLSRYETAIERSYYRALHELQRLQHARLGGHVPPPLAVDVTVSSQTVAASDGPDRAPQPPHTVVPAAVPAQDEQLRNAQLTSERSPEDEIFQ